MEIDIPVETEYQERIQIKLFDLSDLDSSTITNPKFIALGYENASIF